MIHRLRPTALATVVAAAALAIIGRDAVGQHATGVGAAAACAVPADDSALVAGDRRGPDWLLHTHRYTELVDWVARQRRAPTVSASDLAFYEGVLANKQNQNPRSVQLLAPMLARLDSIADSAREHIVLRTLADDYVKAYQYGLAADALTRLYRQTETSMAAKDRHEIRADIDVRELLRTAPPQRASIARPFSVPLRKNVLGLVEAPMRVGADSSWWILDTGANLSTITETMARRLGLQVSSGSASTASSTRESVPLHVAVVPELQIGAARVQNVAVLVLADNALNIPQLSFQISAIIGYPVLDALDHLAMGADSLWVRPIPGEALSPASNLFLEHLAPVVSVTIDGAPRLLLFDSGADRTLLDTRFCRDDSARMAGLAPAHLGLGGAGGISRFQGYRILKLPIGIAGVSATLDSVFVLSETTPSPFEAFYGHLGQDLMAPFGGYTIDFRAMTFRLGTKPE